MPHPTASRLTWRSLLRPRRKRLVPARAGNLKYRSRSGRGSIQLPRATGHEGEGDEEGHLLDERVPRWVRGGFEPRARLVHPRRGAAQVLERSGAGNGHLPVRPAAVRAHGCLLANRGYGSLGPRLRGRVRPNLEGQAEDRLLDHPGEGRLE